MIEMLNDVGLDTMVHKRGVPCSTHCHAEIRSVVVNELGSLAGMRPWDINNKSTRNLFLVEYELQQRNYISKVVSKETVSRNF
jgi:hypothetical protein